MRKPQGGKREISASWKGVRKPPKKKQNITHEHQLQAPGVRKKKRFENKRQPKPKGDLLGNL